MRLLINGDAHLIAQLGPDFLILRAPFDHSPTEATIVLRIDDNERRWNVRLPRGISAASREVVISADK